MKLIKPKNKGWLEKPGYSKKVFLDEKDLQPGAMVQLVKIKPKEATETHHHKKQTEVFYFLNSNGYFIVNNKKIEPEKGDVLVIEPNDRHASINNSTEDFLYIAFKVNWDENDFFWG